MQRPCKETHPLSPDTCHWCKLATTRPDYARLWGEPIPTPGKTPLPLRCRHLGEYTKETVACETCARGARLKLAECALHGRCLPTNKASGVRSCLGCNDFSQEIPPGHGIDSYGLEFPLVRNLIYHLYPRKGQVWRWNVEQLLKRVHLFNGRRVISIAIDPSTEKLQDVEALLAPHVDDIRVVKNVRELGEVVSFDGLLGSIRSVHPSHVTFYGHAKGVTREGHPVVPRWTQLLYEACLDYWPAVEEFLRHYPVVGPLMRRGPGWEARVSKSQWHISGTFFWVRNRDVFTRDWKAIERFYAGVETWPSMLFDAQEVGVLYGDAPCDIAHHTYREDYFNGEVWPGWEQWKQANWTRQTNATISPNSFAIIIPTVGRPALKRTLESVASQQLEPGDEVLLVGDGPTPVAKDIWQQFRLPGRFMETQKRANDWGGEPRRQAIQNLPRARWLLFMDDDDIYTPNALRTIRAVLKDSPRRPHIFRGKFPQGLLWKDREVRLGNVSTQLFAVPNDPHRLGTWSNRYQNDFDFITSTLRHYPDGPVWREEVVAEWLHQPLV